MTFRPNLASGNGAVHAIDQQALYGLRRPMASQPLAIRQRSSIAQSRLRPKKVQGLPAGFRYHDLRHYFASLLIASGADVKTVQARLRHASAKTTLDTYGHIWPDRDESTRAVVDAVITVRTEQRRNSGDAIVQQRRSRPV